MTENNESNAAQGTSNAQSAPAPEPPVQANQQYAYSSQTNQQYNPQQNYQYAQQNAQYNPQQQYAPQQSYQSRSAGIGSPQKEKWVAAVLAFFLGTLGIHKFYLGYKTEGLIMLLVTIIGSCLFIGPFVMLVISYIEAVRYLILTQEDFEATYVRGSKGWL